MRDVTGTQGLIFVIDSNDRTRIDEARTELTRIIQDREMKDALLLVFANKQDLPGGTYKPSSIKDGTFYTDGYTDVRIAMRPNEVSEKLKLSSIAKDHVWKVEPSCATTGEGIFEGLVCFLLFLPSSPYSCFSRVSSSGRSYSN
jgi:ADP-ribosylation factor protein 6